jgi:hypothetical protein
VRARERERKSERERERWREGGRERESRYICGGGALASLCVGSRDVSGGGSSMEEEEEEEVMALGSSYPYARPHA